MNTKNLPKGRSVTAPAFSTFGNQQPFSNLAGSLLSKPKPPDLNDYLQASSQADEDPVPNMSRLIPKPQYEPEAL